MIKKLLLIIILAAVPILMTQHNVAFATAKQDAIDGLTSVNGGNSQDAGNLDKTIQTAINILTIVVGIAAVAMIIIAGLKYITSAGNADKTKSAKNTLLYALVGLVIVALAQSIAHFVLTEASNPSTGTTPKTSTPIGAPGGGGHQT